MKEMYFDLNGIQYFKMMEQPIWIHIPCTYKGRKITHKVTVYSHKRVPFRHTRNLEN